MCILFMDDAIFFHKRLTLPVQFFSKLTMGDRLMRRGLACRYRHRNGVPCFTHDNERDVRHRRVVWGRRNRLRIPARRVRTNNHALSREIDRERRQASLLKTWRR